MSNELKGWVACIGAVVVVVFTLVAIIEYVYGYPYDWSLFLIVAGVAAIWFGGYDNAIGVTSSRKSAR